MGVTRPLRMQPLCWSVDDVDAQVLGLLHHINIPQVVYPSSSF